MVRSEPVPFAIGDVLTLKKAHPCGSHDWTVVRLGADIGLTCHGCGRRVLLPRRDVERRMKRLMPAPPDPEDSRAASGDYRTAPTEPRR